MPQPTTESAAKPASAPAPAKAGATVKAGAFTSETYEEALGLGWWGTSPDTNDRTIYTVEGVGGGGGGGG